MRIWHEKLIPKLCRQHLIAVWREALGCYKIITENKKGYRNHPATQEFINAPEKLLIRLHTIRREMIARGYNPKMIDGYDFGKSLVEEVKEWQTLEEQVERLKAKHCDCAI